MEYRYNIKDFHWNGETKSFYADAPHLLCFNNDGSIHSDAFPNMKSQFFIDNHKTGGFRRFRFVKEITNSLVDENSHTKYEMIDWLFESEDGIQCYINVI